MSMDRPYDISGWATMCNIKCTDGRTIRPNAFIDNDGEEVPMVYQHCHTDPENILGHALLENRDKGVYCYCWFNKNEKAQAAKNAVANGDIKQFSIYANQLVQRGNDVIHGSIKEVSLVLTGANKGARIENLNFAHSDGTTDMDDEEALIYTKSQKILCHSEEDEEEDSEEENKTNAEEEDSEEDVEEESMSKKGTIDVQEIIDGMTEEQRMVLNAMYEQGGLDALAALEDEDEEEEEDEDEDEYDEEDDEAEDEDGDDEDEYEDEEDEEYEEAEAMAHSEIGGNNTMKKNVFDGTMDETKEQGATLTHSEIQTIFADAKREGSLRQAVLAHADDYGITQIDWLFPDARNLNNTPDFIHRDMGWVSKVMQGTKHTPFSRIKTLMADITEDEARAKGYIKGNRKVNEVFTLLKRTTDPQTIYKKQKMDRDDVLDITDFDVVAWLKGEMRMMLDEEIARAILIGDGRLTSSDDHISEGHIRSIFHDDGLYTVHRTLTTVQNEAKAKTFIKTVRRAWKDYKGSGNAVCFMTEDMLSELLLLEDGIGHFLYPTRETAANVLGVREIITVPVMADVSTYRTVGANSYKPLAIIVNLADYNVGADKGGSVNMFEDFDIDLNQQKYLIETRCSGALVKPYAAISIEEAITSPEDAEDHEEEYNPKA